MLLPRQQRVTAQNASAICVDKKRCETSGARATPPHAWQFLKHTQDEMDKASEAIRAIGVRQRAVAWGLTGSSGERRRHRYRAGASTAAARHASCKEDLRSKAETHIFLGERLKHAQKHLRHMIEPGANAVHTS